MIIIPRLRGVNGRAYLQSWGFRFLVIPPPAALTRRRYLSYSRELPCPTPDPGWALHRRGAGEGSAHLSFFFFRVVSGRDQSSFRGQDTSCLPIAALGLYTNKPLVGSWLGSGHLCFLPLSHSLLTSLRHIPMYIEHAMHMCVFMDLLSHNAFDECHGTSPEELVQCAF